MSNRICRREALRRLATSAAGLAVADTLASRLWAGTPAPTAKAKSVIQIWMWGGPCHIDTFDPKPEAGNDYSGPLNQPIETNVRGVRIGELLPMLAKQADKYSIIRSMTHQNNAHETATYMVHTGHKAGERLAHPCAGSVVSLFRGCGAGYQSQIPPYIMLTEPLGRIDPSGFLGARYRPFITGGDPAQPRFVVEGIVAEGITDDQQRQRRLLLEKLDKLPQSLPGNPGLQAFVKSRDQAYDMILGDGAKVFDLSTEKDEVRDRYGHATQAANAKAAQTANARRTTFGQCCLVARRLVEQGVPFITINSPGWDTHKDHFVTMRRQLPEFDKGLAALIQDLADRGLLESTIIWCGGEFGRTPRVQWEAPWNGGRGHWGNAFSTLVAGGGFKGGQVVGATDARGEEVKDRPVAPSDLLGSVYKLLGIDTAAPLPNPQGLEARVLPAPTEAGHRLLTEIM